MMRFFIRARMKVKTMMELNANMKKSLPRIPVQIEKIESIILEQ